MARWGAMSVRIRRLWSTFHVSHSGRSFTDLMVADPSHLHFPLTLCLFCILSMPCTSHATRMRMMSRQSLISARWWAGTNTSVWPALRSPAGPPQTSTTWQGRMIPPLVSWSPLKGFPSCAEPLWGHYWRTPFGRRQLQLWEIDRVPTDSPQLDPLSTPLCGSERSSRPNSANGMPSIFILQTNQCDWQFRNWFLDSIHASLNVSCECIWLHNVQYGWIVFCGPIQGSLT